MPARRPLLLVLIALLAGAACNGSEPSADPTTIAPATTAPPATTAKSIPPNPLLDTMAPLVVQIPALKQPRYTAIFEDFVRAEQSVLKAGMNPVTPDDPEVAARHTGERLASTKQSLDALKTEGRALGTPTVLILEPSYVSAENDHGIVFYACFTIEQPMTEVATGKVVESIKGSELKAIGMELVDGVWKMNLRTRKDEWKGKSCADALLTVYSSPPS